MIVNKLSGTIYRERTRVRSTGIREDTRNMVQQPIDSIHMR